jgi:hypothetical protein
MIKRRYALLGLVTWKVGKRMARRKLHLSRRHGTRALPLVAGGAAAAAALAVVAWRVTHSGDTPAAA